MSHIHTETGKLGKRGVFTIPAPMRKRFGLADGSLIIAEVRDDGILLRPAIATPLQTYSDERNAEIIPLPDPQNASSIALLKSWLEEDATEDPEEIRQAEAELQEFKRNMNQPRKEAGARLLYPEVE
jgi:AbrB family looped-hinge helix DNA binding protein